MFEIMIELVGFVVLPIRFVVPMRFLLQKKARPGNAIEILLCDSICAQAGEMTDNVKWGKSLGRKERLPPPPYPLFRCSRR